MSELKAKSLKLKANTVIFYTITFDNNAFLVYFVFFVVKFAFALGFWL